MRNDEKKKDIEKTDRQLRSGSDDISVIKNDQKLNQKGNQGAKPQQSSHIGPGDEQRLTDYRSIRPSTGNVMQSGGHELTQQQSGHQDVHMSHHAVMQKSGHGSNPPKTSGERRQGQSSGKVIESRKNVVKRDV